MISVKGILIEYLKNKSRTNDPWEWGGKLEDYTRAAIKTKASSASREMRTLYKKSNDKSWREDWKIEREYIQVKGEGPQVVRYRYVDLVLEKAKNYDRQVSDSSLF